MITTKSYLIREVSKLKKRKRNLQTELQTLSMQGPVKDMFKNANEILEKELVIIAAKIEVLLWVANTSQKSLPKIKKHKKSKRNKEVKPEVATDKQGKSNEKKNRTTL